jgi:magnesium transporter
VSNRLNVVMERLTIVATIFLPLTVLTGFFGMNFGWLVNHIRSPWAFLAFGLGGSLLSSLAIVWWIRRNRLT